MGARWKGTDVKFLHRQLCHSQCSSSRATRRSSKGEGCRVGLVSRGRSETTFCASERP
ncbi:uncharacterized protein LACBIDRAFT_299037 [Laccaria bicolor S238N-H82]|uniref:Predicted protein n=1 Tax=Laccaria bicolor (strain S238N-H82 / ATCC MYA-4686) TaxID=486041 RepID=B0DDW5_LACBS|nr:uncharacterized protein LACBIDRAFT_299037 [Laccaria bicolor S238N-H82]EDR07156.1 predicted protein [Laccaria bicolor S238N-H82]|eukprot:XP_001882087.1 predicted protein [Laccaria bicolor S238N-H82]